MHKIPLTIALLCLSQVLFAQKKHNDYFLTYSGRYVNDRDSADFIRVVSEPDSGSKLYNVEEYYKNGQLKSKTKSTRIDPIAEDGPSITYYPNGNLKMKATYVDGYLVGRDYKYYPNGKLYIEDDYGLWNTAKPVDQQYRVYHVITVKDSTGKSLVTDGNGTYSRFNGADFDRPMEAGPVKNGLKDGIWNGRNYAYKLKYTEQYEAGKLIKGSGIDSAGGVHPYTQQFIDPQYPGGMKALYKFIANQLVYPQYARTYGKQGRVILNFTIASDGTVGKIKVLKSVHPVLDAEAVRVLSLSKNWQPAVYCGMPISSLFTIPVGFSLSN